ncbi:N-acetylmuramoyl-L-alanine amidase [Pelosinus sp. IPA-1]|uniref:N-acetylmuramoyl-L-alanine amidase family protein n=1 Tax=Pelosinus sp. IPA-1 TaxID=3029569 RepID=UPI0024362615|nr:N-acetylmuramoyl-L-alanine amidase [Pelosinus sp. IPA-1]GMA97338.1 hypothetical protein PIPA1_01380 [Pelosinus sp. IPA-1]
MKKQTPLLLILLMLLTSLPAATASAASFDTLSQNIINFIGLQSNQTKNSTLKGKVIVVDPGHGGSDTGAIGPNHVAEKNVTLAIARDLGKLLSDGGAKVILTRTSDKDVANEGTSDIDELQARVAIANQASADLFVSIHADASDEPVSGTATYFYGNSDTFASLVQDSMVSQLKLSDRGYQPNDFYVLKNTTMPAILTEVAFISNPQEEKLLSNPTFDKKAALGIYNGIKKYFAQ